MFETIIGIVCLAQMIAWAAPAVQSVKSFLNVEKSVILNELLSCAGCIAFWFSVVYVVSFCSLNEWWVIPTCYFLSNRVQRKFDVD